MSRVAKFTAAGVAAAVVAGGGVAQAAPSSVPDRLRAQIALEQDRLADYRGRVQRELDRARAASVEEPNLPAVRTAALPVVVDLRSSLRRVRARAAQYRATALPALRAWRATVPRTPAWFVPQASRVASCESGHRWSLNVGLFDGGFQFHPDTWTATRERYRAAYGEELPAYAYQASPRRQYEAAWVWLQAIGGVWAQTAGWPVCGRRA